MNEYVDRFDSYTEDRFRTIVTLLRRETILGTSDDQVVFGVDAWKYVDQLEDDQKHRLATNQFVKFSEVV